MSVTQQRLRELVKYDPVTGEFTWLVQIGKSKPGDIAGTLRSDGYIRIQIDGERLYASHWAWLYMTGELPVAEVDHGDRNRANNSWSNLRAATKSQNCANRPQCGRRSDLPRGVTRRGKKFVSQIRVRGETRYLGIYETPEAAHAAYVAVALVEFGEFAAANDNAPGKQEAA